MLYGSATKADLKNRAVDEADSGLASSDENTWRGIVADDKEDDMGTLRRQQRQERREYLQRHSPAGGGNRKGSPSPASKKPRVRHGSAGGSERESSTSPPLTPSPRPSTAGRPGSVSAADETFAP